MHWRNSETFSPEGLTDVNPSRRKNHQSVSECVRSWFSNRPVTMTTVKIRIYLKCCSLEFTIIFFELSSFFWFSRAACMVLTSCCTLVSELPIVATLLKRQKKKKKDSTQSVFGIKNKILIDFWVKAAIIYFFVLFQFAFTFWSSSTVVGRLTNSAADFRLAFKWFTAESNKVIYRRKTPSA